jgi:hypothetical protein
MFDKEHILHEIKRTAKANGGVALGLRKFEMETGIRDYDWGKYWARWSEAQVEAGFAPNALTTAIGDDVLLEAFVGLIRELKKFPAVSDLKVKHAHHPSFPTEKTYRRFGGQAALASKLVAYCRERTGYDDVIALCETRALLGTITDRKPTRVAQIELGYVYLLRSGRNYKIGKTNAVGRRERELAIQLPERADVVRSIKTDDPSGIEAYWHSRFATKRKGGEWFALTAGDVQAFKRRKFM